MIQGLNVQVNIIARVQQADDAVGGSVRSDVVRYTSITARISQPRPSQLLMQQGFEVRDIYEVILYPDRYPAIESEDIVVPQKGQWKDARLRVLTVNRSSLRPSSPRSHIQLMCGRTRYADENTPE